MNIAVPDHNADKAGAGQSRRVFGVVGWKNSGKTTLVTRLIEEFVRRGLKVSAIKHAHHGLSIDPNRCDTSRMRDAGASQIAVASKKRWALMHELRGEDEPGFGEMLSQLAPCDLVIVEGYKKEKIPKIEVRSSRSLTQDPISDGNQYVVAIASDQGGDECLLPHFNVDDVPAIADFISQYLDAMSLNAGVRAFEKG